MTRAEADKLIMDLFDSSYYTFVHYSLRAVHDRTVAEDVVQQALMLLYRDVRHGVVIDQPKAWTFCVIRRLISKYVRIQHRQAALHEQLSVFSDFSTRVVDSEPARGLSDVNKLFSVLTPREQDVMTLRMMSLKYREIGDRLGISPQSVNTLLARAVRKLQVAAGTAHRASPPKAVALRYVHE